MKFEETTRPIENYSRSIKPQFPEVISKNFKTKPTNQTSRGKHNPCTITQPYNPDSQFNIQERYIKPKNIDNMRNI